MVDFRKMRDISYMEWRGTTPAGKTRKGRPHRLVKEARSQNVMHRSTPSFGGEAILRNLHKIKEVFLCPSMDYLHMQ
jgi:hypothetical protein